LTAYVDTSFMVCLYLPDVHSAKAHHRMTEQPMVWLTPLHRAEVAHVVAQQVFQGRIAAAEGDRAYNTFENDKSAGLWLEAPVPEAVWDLAVELSRQHVARLGCRTLDTLHVASALELGATKFWTFDQRQERLAKAAGLSTS
jgi:predicted nucleic acid-binding protein